MNKPTFLKVSCIVFIFCVMTAIASSAQTFETYSFDGTDGSAPEATLVQGIDGNFYGTTGTGGSGSNSNCAFGCGTIFKITPAGKLTIVHSFDYTDGFYPDGALVQGSDGNFYGTTEQGGANSLGTVFKITPAGALTTLYSFCAQASCGDGSLPTGALVPGANGNFYGVTGTGGSSSSCQAGCGTVFKVTATGTLTTLYSFCSQKGCLDGAAPESGLVQGTDGDFYGTTVGNFAGTVFKITASGKLTTLHRFSVKESAEGYNPRGALVQATDGNFYGTAEQGGATGFGTVFQITPAGTLTTVYSFCALARCADGDSPNAGVVQGTDGNFYGTTYYGGNNGCAQGYSCGIVFQLTPAGTLTTLHSFDATDGGFPEDGLVQVTNGSFYGTTLIGGSSTNCEYGCGTLFNLSTGLGPFVTTKPFYGKVGAKVIILGNNLTGTTGVTFNGTTATVLKVTASAIEVSVPTGATTGTVTVTTPSGTLDSNVPFQVLP